MRYIIRPINPPPPVVPCSICGGTRITAPDGPYWGCPCPNCLPQSYYGCIMGSIIAKVYQLGSEVDDQILILEETA